MRYCIEARGVVSKMLPRNDVMQTAASTHSETVGGRKKRSKHEAITHFIIIIAITGMTRGFRVVFITYHLRCPRKWVCRAKVTRCCERTCRNLLRPRPRPRWRAWKAKKLVKETLLKAAFVLPGEEFAPEFVNFTSRDSFKFPRGKKCKNSLESPRRGRN